MAKAPPQRMSQRWRVKSRKKRKHTKRVNLSPFSRADLHGTGRWRKEPCGAPSEGTERVSSKNNPAERPAPQAVLSSPTHSSHTEDNKEIRLSPS